MITQKNSCPWTKYNVNKEILDISKVKRILSNTEKDRQLHYCGHVIRRGSLQGLQFERKLNGKRLGGIPIKI